LKKDEVDVDSASLARGIRDAILGNKSLLTDDEAKAALMALLRKFAPSKQVKLTSGAANKRKAPSFLPLIKQKTAWSRYPAVAVQDRKTRRWAQAGCRDQGHIATTADIDRGQGVR